MRERHRDGDVFAVALAAVAELASAFVGEDVVEEEEDNNDVRP